jgi:hypothetical protein
VLVLFAVPLLVVALQAVLLVAWVGLPAAPGVLVVVAPLVVLLVVQVGLLVVPGAPLVVGPLEVLVPLLGESAVLGLVVALVAVVFGLVGVLPKGFHQQGQILAF